MNRERDTAIDFDKIEDALLEHIESPDYVFGKIMRKIIYTLTENSNIDENEIEILEDVIEQCENIEQDLLGFKNRYENQLLKIRDKIKSCEKNIEETYMKIQRADENMQRKMENLEETNEKISELEARMTLYLDDSNINQIIH